MTHQAVFACKWDFDQLNVCLLKNGADGQCTLEETRRGPGTGAVSLDRFEDVLFDTISDWSDLYPDAPIIISECDGALKPWRETDPAPCPHEVVKPTLGPVFQLRDRDVCILQELSCVTPLGQPDTSGGVQAEICGWLNSQEHPYLDEFLLCIVGNNRTKWVRIHAGRVMEFFTGLTGEMHALLIKNRRLIDSPAEPNALPDAHFRQAVMNMAEGNPLIHELYSVQTRGSFGLDEAADATQRLSGLVIGADVTGALSIYGVPPTPVVIIAAESLAQRYRTALELNGATALCVEENVAVRGFWTAAQALLPSDQNA